MDPPTAAGPGADAVPDADVSDADVPDADGSDADVGSRVPRGLWREAVASLPDLGRLLRDLARDPRTPRRAKIIAAGAAGYVASPFDLLPDVVPGVGGLDDLLLVSWAIRRLVAIAGYDLVRELWTGTDGGFAVLIVLAGMDR
jgi:uncharacterized membrane protein YkvA (DUF1232 family)